MVTRIAPGHIRYQSSEHYILHAWAAFCPLQKKGYLLSFRRSLLLRTCLFKTFELCPENSYKSVHILNFQVVIVLLFCIKVFLIVPFCKNPSVQESQIFTSKMWCILYCSPSRDMLSAKFKRSLNLVCCSLVKLQPI